MKYSTYKKSDKAEIHDLFVRAFTNSEGKTEGTRVGDLVLALMGESESPDVTGFVARDDGRIVGCIFFTSLYFEAPLQACLLSPVAVHADYQGKGIGQKLIGYGIGKLMNTGVEAIFTYGDPDFYTRVGFEPVSEYTVAAPYKLSRPEGWLCRSLDGAEIGPVPGIPRCVDAFKNPDLW